MTRGLWMSLLCVVVTAMGCNGNSDCRESKNACAADFLCVEDAGNWVCKEKTEALTWKVKCAKGLGVFCGRIGLAYLKGESGVKKDPKQALKYFKLACDDQNSVGCSMAGLMYVKGDEVEKDELKGLEFLEKSCEHGGGSSCYLAGSLYLNGKGAIKKDLLKSAKLWGKGCDLKDEKACQGIRMMAKALKKMK